MNENVVQLPEPLERLASQIKRDVERCKAAVKKTEDGRREWIEAAYDLCLHLAAAKAEHPALIEFGQWCHNNGFGEKIINRNTRAAAIAMAEQPNALRKCLEDTARRSLDTIHKFDFGRFHNVMKTAKPRREHKPRTEDKQKATAEAIRPLVESGGTIDREAVAEKLGVSEATVQRAVQRERGRLEGLHEAATYVEPAKPAEMAPSMRQRYEAALRVAEKRLREELVVEIRAEVFKEYDFYIQHLNEKNDRAERILNNHKGLISREMFRRIKACLHPDHNSFTFAAEALQAFSELEDVMVKAEPSAIAGPPLPRTAAEMMARRRTKR